MKKIIKRLSDLFSGSERGHGVYKLSGEFSSKGKAEGKAKTVTGRVTLGLWEKHVFGAESIGVVPICEDSNCVFAAIDIDEYDLDLIALEQKIHKKKLPLIVVRTKSGGAHCYIFFSEPTPAFEIRELLVVWAIELGFPGVEIFPKQDNLASKSDIGNWLNMPYFNYKDTNRYAIVAGESLDIKQFVEYAESRKISIKEIKNTVQIDDDSLEEAPPCLNTMLRSGIQQGSRNDALLNLGVYARLKYGEDWPNWLDKYNTEYFDPPLGHKEVTTILKSLSKKSYFYSCKRPPICNFCNKDLCAKRKYGISSGDDLGINIESLTKIDSDPPMWIAQVTGKRVELMTEELMNQLKFQAKCISALNYFPSTIKPEKWKKLINTLLGDLRVLEAPPDSGPAGQLEFYLDQFCTIVPQASSRDEVLQGKPWTDCNHTWFRQVDLFEYLKRRKFNEYNSKNFWPALKKITDIRHKQFQIKGKCVWLWGVPERQFQNEDHAIKRIGDEESF